MLALVISLGLGMAPALAAPTYQWKLAHEEPADGFMDRVSKEFAKKLNEKSNGDIEVTIYPSGTLGSAEDMIEQTQNGSIELHLASTAGLAPQIPQVQALLLHYLFPKDLNVVKKVMLNGKFRSILDPYFYEKKLEPLAFAAEGWQVWSTNKPIKSPADYQGVKMRTMLSPLLISAYKAYGANPTPVEFSQVFSSLQLKMIDGQENPICTIEDMKFYEVQSNLTFGYSGLLFVSLLGNKAAIDALPEPTRKIVMDASREVTEYAFLVAETISDERMERMLKSKPSLEIAYLDDAAVKEFRKLAAPIFKVYATELGGKQAPEILQALLSDITEASRQ